MADFRFAMWRAGVKVDLAEVLGAMPANHWIWNVLEFEGVGQLPNDQSVVEFERVARLSPLGHRMSWAELTSFAAGVNDTWWFLAVASMPGVELVPDEVRNEVYDRAVFVLSGFDSTSWEVHASSESDESMAALELLRTKFAVRLLGS